MKNYLLLLFAILPGCLLATEGYLTTHRFNSPQGPYLEMTLHLPARGLVFLPQADNTVQAQIEVTVLIHQGDEVVRADKFLLIGQDVKPVDLVDVKRYLLKNGRYRLEAQLQDINTDGPPHTLSELVHLHFDSKQPLMQSDPMLLAGARPDDSQGQLTRNGVRMDPLPYLTYGPSANELIVYEELYGTDTHLESDFTISLLVNERPAQGDPIPRKQVHLHYRPAEVVPVLGTVPIADLHNGHYRLWIEVRTREKVLLTRNWVDFRRGPLAHFTPLGELPELVATDGDFVRELDSLHLRYSLLALTPFIPQQDLQQVNQWMHQGNISAQRAYLRHFWTQQAPHHTAAEYSKYMAVASAVDKAFRSGFRNGFETDRGYVYLKYGPPNNITRSEFETSAPPYEIWSYDEVKLTHQNNVRFVFYNPTLAAEDFELLHSDVTGERNYPQWQHALYSYTPDQIKGKDFINGTKMQDNVNRRAARIYKDH